MSNTPIGDGLAERMSFLIQCAERLAAMEERTAIIKILTDELTWQEKKNDNQEVCYGLLSGPVAVPSRLPSYCWGRFFSSSSPLPSIEMMSSSACGRA